MHIALILAAQAIIAGAIPFGPPEADGTRYLLIEGDRAKPAPFSYAFSLPGGTWDKPHSHSQTARIFVQKGTLKLGWGAQMDKAKAQSYPAGSYIVVPAGAVHFDGADEDTVIIGVASGPWRTDYVDGSKGSAGTPQ
ncbi:MAG: cupin domain-containing protein [Sphingomonadales bacterium]|jgi:hypothetical protein